MSYTVHSIRSKDRDRQQVACGKALHRIRIAQSHTRRPGGSELGCAVGRSPFRRRAGHSTPSRPRVERAGDPRSRLDAYRYRHRTELVSHSLCTAANPRSTDRATTHPLSCSISVRRRLTTSCRIELQLSPFSAAQAATNASISSALGAARAEPRAACHVHVHVPPCACARARACFMCMSRPSCCLPACVRGRGGSLAKGVSELATTGSLSGRYFLMWPS